MNTLRKKWLTYAISGLVVFGFGISLTGEAIIMKMTQSEHLGWVAYGTLALVVVNSGLCLFGQAVIYKVKLETTINN
ncbi:MAG: hypothetical protein AAGC88_12795 [Bacteroidota bacterium]